MAMPLASAIIATYNRAYVVGEAIDSILRQTYPEVEVIVVDDGSSDNTQEKLKGYGDRIRVAYQKNAGPSAARNQGIKLARGEIIAFLDSDDMWLPTFVERHVSVLERGGPSVPCSISNARARFANGQEHLSFEIARLRPSTSEGLWMNPLDVLATRFVMCCQMLAIRRETLDRVGGFDNALRYMEDYDIALRLSLEGPWGFIREPLVRFRQSAPGESLSLSITTEDPRLHECIAAIRQKAGALMKARRPALSSPYVAPLTHKARCDAWATRWKNDRSSTKRSLGAAVRHAEHYGEVLWRCSPFFPKMKTVPFQCEGLA